ncbi:MULTISPECIES: hypothetical protein [unclassified Tolypothrix]|nr:MULTISPECIES: hypothetical protein [unclassified Tolypothrix]
MSRPSCLLRVVMRKASGGEKPGDISEYAKFIGYAADKTQIRFIN